MRICRPFSLRPKLGIFFVRFEGKNEKKCHFLLINAKSEKIRSKSSHFSVFWPIFAKKSPIFQ
jgi:hypothetical protein